MKSVHFISATTGYAVGDSATILKTTNGGTTWTAQNSGITGMFKNLNAVYFTDVNTGYAVGQSGKIIKTTNGGTTWTAQTTNVTNDIFSIQFLDANTGYAVGWTKVLKTTNGGTTWTVQNSGISGTYDNLNAVFFINANLGYTVGLKGRILKTTNGGSVGINENTSAIIFRIYPNPASDYFTIIHNDKNNSTSTVNIYNAIGKLVKAESMNQNQQTINSKDLSNGIYIVEIKTKEKTSTQKLLIQR